MKILVLGGTLFLSRTVAKEALSRGHEVLCAARGESGRAPRGATLVPTDRDRPDAYDQLKQEHFDAVVDVARTSVTWAREAVRSITANHWTFVSSCSVYADHSRPGRYETLEPLEDDPSAEFTSERYGAQKVAAENAVKEVHEDAFIVRAGLITGPGDPSDRFGYWPARMSQGGQVVVPDAVDQAAQHIDVRDLAAWIVDAAEQRLKGTFDATGPSEPLGMMLGEIAGATAAPGTELVRIPEGRLTELNVTPWSGPRSLPLWLPPTHRAMMFRDAGPALAAGLKTRPLAETAVDSLEYERGLGIDRHRKAGLTPREEHEVLTAAG